MQGVFEELAEIVFGVTGMLALRIIGRRDHEKSDTRSILVGIGVWALALALVGLGVWLVREVSGRA